MEGIIQHWGCDADYVVKGTHKSDKPEAGVNGDLWKQLNTDIRNKVVDHHNWQTAQTYFQKISVRIDGICEKLNNDSGELESHSRIQNILVNKSVPESWNRDSQNNVQVSRNSR